VFVLALAIEEESNKIRKRRRFCCKSWLQRRDQYSDMRLLHELQENNPDDFKNYLRMDKTAFSELLTAVTPYIVKHDTVMSRAISPKERLTATIRVLATGRQLEDLKFSTGISPQSLGKIIPETCSAIFHALRGQYLNVTHFFGSKSGKSCGPNMRLQILYLRQSFPRFLSLVLVEIST